MNEEIAVSIICNAYNHEKYIRDALDGFVMQKTNFRFEVLVHDDASTDRTADIIREYEKKYPELIKPIYQTENQYSKGKGMVSRIQNERSKGKYIAVCEGDDYWTDPYKLQKQYDAMEAHPEIDICAHAASIINADTKKIIGIKAPSDKDTVLTVEQVITGGGGYVATNTLFYRRSINANDSEFRKKRRIDYTLQILGSLRGGMLYLADNMAEYRRAAKGSWTERVSRDDEKYKKHVQVLSEMLDLLDEETDHKYSEAINKRRLINEFELLERQRDIKTMMTKPYIEILKEQPTKHKIRIILEAYLPWLFAKKGNK